MFSELGSIVLGEVISKVRNQSLPDSFFQILTIAGMRDTVYLPKTDKYKIVPAESTSNRPTVVESQACENDLNPLLCDEARRHINFYNFCLKEVQNQVTTLKDEESIRTIATSVFIQSMRSNV